MSNLRQTAGAWASSRLARGGRPLRFLIAGGLNTAFGLSIYPALLWSSPWLHTHYMMALAIAQAVSLVFAFCTYKFGVFRTRSTNVAREFGTFASFYLANYAANWIALPLLVEHVSLDPVVAQIGFSVLVIVGSWFWHSRVTFAERSPFGHMAGNSAQHPGQHGDKAP